MQGKRPDSQHDTMPHDSDRPTWLQHTLNQQPWGNQRQVVATLALVVVIGIIIATLYLIQTTTTATTAREVQEMLAQRDDLVLENERLRAEIAELESQSRLMTRAAEMGFREAGEGDIRYVIVDGYRYNRPLITPTPTPTPPPDAPDYDETLGGWLREQWDSLRQQFDEWRSE